MSMMSKHRLMVSDRAANSACSTLDAIRWPIVGCSARYTEPLLPCPSKCRTTWLPIVLRMRAATSVDWVSTIVSFPLDRSRGYQARRSGCAQPWPRPPPPDVRRLEASRSPDTTRQRGRSMGRCRSLVSPRRHRATSPVPWRCRQTMRDRRYAIISPAGSAVGQTVATRQHESDSCEASFILKIRCVLQRHHQRNPCHCGHGDRIRRQLRHGIERRHLPSLLDLSRQQLRRGHRPVAVPQGGREQRLRRQRGSTRSPTRPATRRRVGPRRAR